MLLYNQATDKILYYLNQIIFTLIFKLPIRFITYQINLYNFIIIV